MVGCIYRHFKGISIHASAKEATCRRIICIFIILFYFNPRLREGGDSKSPALISPLLISIHASAKEATIRKPVRTDRALFQSTPPRRRRPQHIVIPQLSCTYLVSTTFLSTFFSFISQYVVLFFLF